MMKTIIKESPIHGLGLFSKIDIKKGTQLGKFEYTHLQLHTSDPYPKDHPHVLQHCTQGYVLMTDEFRFINSSPKPNVELYEDDTIIAIKNIKVGEEILSEYEDWL